MSSHYIYLECTTRGCETAESLYTGNIQSDLFDDAGPDSWEGETIRVRCKECQAGQPPSDLFPGIYDALDRLTIRTTPTSKGA